VTTPSATTDVPAAIGIRATTTLSRESNRMNDLTSPPRENSADHAGLSRRESRGSSSVRPGTNEHVTKIIQRFQ
jgi:hypothetical protein